MCTHSKESYPCGTVYCVFNNSNFNIIWKKPANLSSLYWSVTTAQLTEAILASGSISLYPSNSISTVCSRKDRGDVGIGVWRLDERKVSTATEACICTATKKQRLSILGLSYPLDTSESDYVYMIWPTAVRKSFSLETTLDWWTDRDWQTARLIDWPLISKTDRMIDGQKVGSQT